MSARDLRDKFQCEKKAMNFLHDELDKERLTARGFHKVMRVAWTIADLAGNERPTREDTERAFLMREGFEV